MPDLSPAAQAVANAYGDFEPADTDALAAALRAAASQLTSAKAADQLRAIATELENADA